jgi:alkyl sulfatase BDS1-like metallo-beta-lactamase superfamily hydrolase
MATQLLFDVIAVRVNAPKAASLAFRMAWHFPDRGEHWLLELSNGALNSMQFDTAQAADVALTLDRTTLEAILQQRLQPMQAITEGSLRLSGNATLLGSFFGLLDRFAGNFPVVDAAPWPA